MMTLDVEPGLVRLTADGHLIGRATWVVTEPGEGLVQLLSITIDPAHQRRGYGRRLLHGLYDAARGQLEGVPLRRVWVCAGNKAHVIARAFFTGEGYHHVGSNSGVWRDQDLLVYVKSFD